MSQEYDPKLAGLASLCLANGIELSEGCVWVDGSRVSWSKFHSLYKNLGKLDRERGQN